MNAVAEKPAAIDSGSQTIATPSPPRRSTRKALLRGAMLLILVGGGVVAGAWWLKEGRYIESTDNAYVQGDIAVLGPRIEGDVLSIHVADNQQVRAGDKLISLDPIDYQAKLDQARGQADEAVAAVETASRQADLARASIAQADAMAEQARAELTRAAAEASRTGTLVGAGWTSHQANEQAVADNQKAVAGLAAAQAGRATAAQNLRVAEAQVHQAQARQVTAEAAVRLAASNLEHTVIRAPFDGVVGNRSAQLGQHVQPGQQLIAVAPLASRLFVVANFKETQLGRMKPGQKVLLTADIGGDAVHGYVDSLAPATGALFSLLPPENATGNFTKVVQRVPVKVVVDPADEASADWLRAGLSVTAEVDTRGPTAERHGLLGTALALVR